MINRRTFFAAVLAALLGRLPPKPLIIWSSIPRRTGLTHLMYGLNAPRFKIRVNRLEEHVQLHEPHLSRARLAISRIFRVTIRGELA